MNILETEDVERFRSRIDPARVEYSMYPTKQKDGEGLQQRAEDALGELGRDHLTELWIYFHRPWRGCEAISAGMGFSLTSKWREWHSRFILCSFLT